MEVKISVIMPVYNAEKYLRQSIDSVLHQTFAALELICVDDGSSDASADILGEYSKLDSRVRIIQRENGGPGAARNTGLEAAEGKYIAFLDSDDAFEADALESMFELAEKCSADITVCRTQRFDDQSGHKLPSAWMLKTELCPSACFSPADIKDNIFQFTYGMVWDKLWRRGFIEENKLRFPLLRAAEDTAFVYKALLLSERIAILDAEKIRYRVNVNTSVSNSFTRHPSAPFDAFELIYDFVYQNDLIKTYERSFINWSMEYLVWQVFNMPDMKVRQQYYELVNKIWFPKVGFSNYSRRYYTDRKKYLKYLIVKYVPINLLNSAILILK